MLGPEHQKIISRKLYREIAFDWVAGLALVGLGILGISTGRVDNCVNVFGIVGGAYLIANTIPKIRRLHSLPDELRQDELERMRSEGLDVEEDTKIINGNGK